MLHSSPPPFNIFNITKKVTMASGGKHVVFDIVGTCVGYEAFFEAIDARIGDRLRAHCITPKVFAFAWMECAEREFTFLDLSGRYKPFFPIFRPLFHRVLGQVGIPKVRELFSEEDADVCADAYKDLRARPGVQEAWQKLRDAGFTVWALTTGDKARVKGYLAGAGLECPDENFFTCDGLDVRKPVPQAYHFVLDQFKGAEQTWFAAAHMWDASGAKANGFKAAWCSVWEIEPVPEIFGEVDVVADSLVEMAEKIIEASKD